MAQEDTWSPEQRRYISSIVGMPDPTTVNPFDNTQPGLAPGTESGNVSDNSDIVKLPFRFTQFQLNAGNKAASGQWERTAVARSPFTSGALAGELEGIRGQLAGIQPMAGPPEAPEYPTLPEPPPSEPVTTNEQAMKYGMPVKTYEVPSNLWGSGKNPLQVAMDWERMKPDIEAAGIDMSQFGPMTQVEGYDIKSMLGDQYDAVMKGEGPESTFYQNLSRLPTSFDPMLYKTTHQINLATKNGINVDHSIAGDQVRTTEGSQTGSGFYRPDALLDVYQNAIGAPSGREMGWSADTGGGPLETMSGLDRMLYQAQLMQLPVGDGEGQGGRQPAPTYSTPFGGVNPFETGELRAITLPDGREVIVTTPESKYNIANSMADETYWAKRNLYNDPTMSGMQKFWKAFIPSVIMAGGAAITGGAMGALMAPAAAPAAGAAGATAGAGAGAAGGGAAAAGGVAGAMGMSAGVSATAVNMAANMVASYGLRAAAEQMGLPMDHPVMAAAVQLAGGAAGGALQGLASPVPMGGAGVIGQTQIPESGVLTMPGVDGGQLYTSPEGLTQTITDNPNVIGQIQPGGGASFYEINPGTFQGFTPAPSTPNMPTGSQATGQVIRSGAGALQATQTTDGGTGPMDLYNAEMAEYERALQEYNQQVAQQQAYQTALEERAAQIEAMMAQFNEQASAWDRYSGLTSRQTGIQNQIQSNLAKSGAYDPNERLSGMQGNLWR